MELEGGIQKAQEAGGAAALEGGGAVVQPLVLATPPLPRCVWGVPL